MIPSFLGHRCLFACLVALSIGAWGRTAFALSDSDKEAVRILSNQAAEDYNQGRFEEAGNKFRAAYAAAKVPRLAVWLGRIEVKLGHFVAAYELYREAISLQPTDLWRGEAQQKAQLDAQVELNELGPRIPRLTVVLQGAEASSVSVTVDDGPVPNALVGVERMIDPGQHRVAANRRGEVVTQAVTMREGEKQQVVLKFGLDVAVGPAPAQPMRLGAAGQANTSSSIPAAPTSSNSLGPQRTLAWLSVGVGAAGLVAGTVAGIYVATKHASLNDVCGDGGNQCPSLRESEVKTYKAMRVLSPVGFVVGGLGGAIGVTLLLTSPKHDAEPRLALRLHPGLLSLNGSF